MPEDFDGDIWSYENPYPQLMMYPEVMDFDTPEIVLSLEVYSEVDGFSYCTMTGVDFNEDMIPKGFEVSDCE